MFLLNKCVMHAMNTHLLLCRAFVMQYDIKEKHIENLITV